MLENDTSPLWIVYGATAQGSAHKFESKPCQDAIHWQEWNEEDLATRRIILAVADGHGSNRSPYSAQGASLAVACACEVLDEFYRERVCQTSFSGFSHIKQIAEWHVPRIVISRWREAVKNEFSTQFPNKALPDEDSIWELYGTTLLSVLITDQLILCVQIGDGDILVVSEEETVSWLIPKDESVVGLKVYSLATLRAEKHFRVALHIFPTASTLPKLLMLSTDGYYNSFESTEGFCQTALDYLTFLRQHDPGYIQQHLPSWLTETSKQGSKDDITVGLIWRRNRPAETDRLPEDEQVYTIEEEDSQMSPNETAQNHDTEEEV